VRQQPALDQHGQRIGNGENRIHVVLDQKHRVVGGKVAQERGDPASLFRPHATERLIENKKLRTRSDQHRDLELALLAMAQM
jgi:hypothetical protein